MPEHLSEPRSVEDLISRGYAVRPFNYLEMGWQAFKDYPLGFIGFSIMFIVVSQALPLLAPMAGQVLSIAVQVVMMAGIALVTWGQLRGGQSRFAEFFPDWETTGRLLLCTLAALILIAIGLVLF